jgi:hypothetical protein
MAYFVFCNKMESGFFKRDVKQTYTVSSKQPTAHYFFQSKFLVHSTSSNNKTLNALVRPEMTKFKMFREKIFYFVGITF